MGNVTLITSQNWGPPPPPQKKKKTPNNDSLGGGIYSYSSIYSLKIWQFNFTNIEVIILPILFTNLTSFIKGFKTKTLNPKPIFKPPFLEQFTNSLHKACVFFFKF